MRQRKKVAFNESISRHIFHTKRSRLHGLAWVGIAFGLFVALLGYFSYTSNCGYASVPCSIPFYPYQG